MTVVKNKIGTKMSRNNRTGFTLIEILVVVFILVVISTISVQAFNRYKERQNIDVNTQIVAEALKEARDQTLDSLDSSSYGVHVSSSTAIVFKGSVYSPLDPSNENRNLLPPVIVASTTLSGTDIVFERLTGETLNPGSIFIGVPGKDLLKEIVIEPTGLIYVRD